ncbi:MAG: RNA-binding domain-containing protein [Candidatus Baldrarchaeia archaeon]
MIKLRVETPLNPTEDPKKVELAIRNIFPTVNITIEGEGIRRRMVGLAEGVDALRELHRKLREQRILDTARSIFKRKAIENIIVFHINKQVAFMGKVNFCEPEENPPLGPITVEIVSDSAEKIAELIDWLAPPTRHGKPLFEREFHG